MTSFRVTLALVLVTVAVLLAAGCFGGDAIAEQDGELIRLNPVGNITWTRTIDSGRDDMIADMLETPGGNYVIAGGESATRCNQWLHYPDMPVLTFVSGSGAIISRRNYDYGFPDGFISIFLAPDSTYRGVSERGLVWKMDRNGDLVWNRSVRFLSAGEYRVSEGGDVDIIAGNGTVVRVSPDGTVLADENSSSHTVYPASGDGRSGRGCRDSMCWLQTGDGGFVYLNTIPETRQNKYDYGIRYQAMKTDSRGAITWTKDVIFYTSEKGVGDSAFKKIIQTGDGGYLLAFEREKVYSC